ncbi:MAG: restriction endonuclease, partial [Bacteroidota bacterium]
PLHLVGFRQDPDKRRAGVDRLSPHALVQEYLNRKEEFLYGLVSNGLRLRLLRDNARLKQQQYAEWDLQRIFEEDRFSEFAQLYRLLHASRLRAGKNNPAACLLETYHQKGIEEGNRVRDGLRDAVMEALRLLGNGFLQHRDNDALRAAIRDGNLSPEEYNRQLRRLIYRLLFLLVAEERELIFGDEQAVANEQRRIRQIYRQHYSMNRLREMAMMRRRCDGQAQNVWRELLVTFGIFESESQGKPFGITPLDGELFHPEALGALKDAALHNSVLLEALYRLNTYEDRTEGIRRRINYRSLDVEELGSVYESLLDLHPFIQEIAGDKMAFDYIKATERKTTGSYYTRHDLVAELLQSTLEPVMNERLQAAGKDATKQAEALLQLKVCDPSCGSGHFLLAAARRISLELARTRSHGDQPAASSVRACLREVIEHCIYGVDLNPDAVELCQVA